MKKCVKQPQTVIMRNELLSAAAACGACAIATYLCLKHRRRGRGAHIVDFSSQHPPCRAADVLSTLAKVAEVEGHEFDTYGTGMALQRFERSVAQLFAKPAALFFATGTAAQQAALYAHLQPGGSETASSCKRPVVLLHGTSHLVFLDCLRDAETQLNSFEQNARCSLSDFDVVPFSRGSLLDAEDFRRLPKCEDVERALRVGRHARGRRPAVVILELPQRMNGGSAISLEELRRISALCREVCGCRNNTSTNVAGSVALMSGSFDVGEPIPPCGRISASQRSVKLHCDGARLWEVQPHYGVSFPELAGLFDSIYISFYKGVGALAGAMLIGENTTVAAARKWQKRNGGDLFTRGPLSLSCEIQFRRAVLGESIGRLRALMPFRERYYRLKRHVLIVQRLVADFDREHLQPILKFDPPEVQSCMVHCYLQGELKFLERCHEITQKRAGTRLWNRLRGPGHRILPHLLDNDARLPQTCSLNRPWCYFEWSMGPENAMVPDHLIQAGWRTFLEVYSTTESTIVNIK